MLSEFADPMTDEFAEDFAQVENGLNTRDLIKSLAQTTCDREHDWKDILLFRKESESKDDVVSVVVLPIMHNRDRSYNVTQSNPANKDA